MAMIVSQRIQAVRILKFDAGHRVVKHESKCRNLHGHEYKVEVFCEAPELDSLGRIIDFSCIKEVFGKWIDDHLDHGSILNPRDPLCDSIWRDATNKVWFMSLYGFKAFCNPTVENISKEIFLAMELLMQDEDSGLHIQKVKIFETPNCFTECTNESISDEQRENFQLANKDEIERYGKSLGVVEYDSRKL